METLKNGATEIARLVTGDKIVVLAKRDTDYEPYVTWRMDADGNCYWGHYFATHNEATADFISR
jgi:hypothetical protein